MLWGQEQIVEAGESQQIAQSTSFFPFDEYSTGPIRYCMFMMDEKCFVPHILAQFQCEVSPFTGVGTEVR